MAQYKKMCFGFSRLNPEVEKTHGWDFGVILACFKNFRISKFVLLRPRCMTPNSDSDPLFQK